MTAFTELVNNWDSVFDLKKLGLPRSEQSSNPLLVVVRGEKPGAS